MHLSCFVKTLFSWDKMNHLHSPKKTTSYNQEPSLGRIFKCPACNQIEDPGLLFVHHCDGSLITVQHLPCYPIEAHNQLAVVWIPHDERIRFVPRRRRWLREHIFPIVWEEAKLRTYFNDESVPKSYFNLRTDEPVITSDNILLKADLVEEHDAVDELETNTKANDQTLNMDKESNIDQSKGGENGQSPSKTVDDEGYTTSQEQLNPGGSDTESEGTSLQTERVDPVIEPARKKNKGRQSTSSSGDASGSDTETHIAQNASNQGTGQVDATNNPVTQPLTKKKRRRQRIRPRGGHVLGLEDDKDAKIVWDVYDNVPPDYCKKDDKNNLLQFYRTKREADLYGDDVFFEDKEISGEMNKIRANLVTERKNKNKRAVQALLVEEKKLLKRLDTEKNCQRYDQVIRLKYIGATSCKVKGPKGKGLVQLKLPACWYGMVMNGHVTTALQTRWVTKNFPKPVLEHIRLNTPRFVDVPPGAGDTLESSNQENSLENRWTPPMQRPVIWAHQTERDWKCLYYSTASTLHFVGDIYGASVMKKIGDELHVNDAVTYHSFISFMSKLGYTRSHCEKKCSFKTCNSFGKNSFLIGQLCGNDGGIEHVIGMVDDLIFDCNSDVATPLTDHSINRCCGDVGFFNFRQLHVFSKHYVVTKQRRLVYFTKQRK
jgi:hypothetical protein